MKTLDEIKKGLEQCVKAESGETGCSGCPYIMSCIKEEDPDSIMAVALSYIQQLESRLAQVERERDAALHDLKLSDGDECAFCKHTNLRDELCAKNGYDCVTCADQERCVCLGCTRNEDKWEWRGVCSENAKEE